MIGIAGIGKSRLVVGVLQVLRRARRARSSGTAAAASPTARASPTGRWPTWCGCAAGSPRTRSRRRRSAKLQRHARGAHPRCRGARASSSLGWPTCSGSPRAQARDQRGPVRRLAPVLRAARRRRIRRCSPSRTCSGRTRALLDFIEHLLDWSRNHPLFVLTLARPELRERRPTWGAGQRSFTSLYLEPLPQRAMDDLLDRPRPGPARRTSATRSSRAPRASRCTRSRRCGCCSTAACSCRRARLPGRPGRSTTLEVPETLHALIAARLDGLAAGGAAARPGRGGARQDVHEEQRSPRSPAPMREPRAAARVACAQGGAVDLQADPRSPEHGQYGFLQDLVRHVAYETLSKRERRAQHLAAAEAPQASVRRTRTRWSR